MTQHHRTAFGFFALALSCLYAPPALSASDTSGLQLPTRKFFQNSVRRDATALESDQVVNAKGCAAFFVANTRGKTYLISARHCFGYQITSWCANDGRLVDNEGNEGRCRRIVAADMSHDIALFEAEFEAYTEPDAALRLASFEPEVNTRLVMIGYPADKFRKGTLTTTEECWVLRKRVASPHPHSALKDRSALHNCTTYGGNSGGPMIAEGTDIALGLPFTYAPNDYHERDPWNPRTAAYLAQMADFVSVHRRTLEDAGVEIADGY